MGLLLMLQLSLLQMLPLPLSSFFKHFGTTLRTNTRMVQTRAWSAN